MIVPKDIEQYLVRDEVIEKEFYLRGRIALSGHELYASNKRLFIKRGNSIRDVDYNHISSIELKQERNWGLVFLAVLLGGTSWIVSGLGWTYWWAPAALGAVVFVLGLTRTQFIAIAVVGLPRALRVSGHRSGLDSLFRLVREKRV